MDSLEQDLLQELICVVCMEYMLPPITLCTNGHNICHSCKTSLSRCPSCRGKLVDTRSRAVENLSNRITHPCKYRASGCTAQCLVDFKQQHEKECSFTPIKCPCALSKLRGVWEGPVHDMKEHIKDSHGSLIASVVGPFQLFPVTEEGKASWSFIFIFDEIFLTCSKQINSFIHRIVMFVGSKEQAENFNYRITIKSEDNKQSMSVCLTCRSYLELFEKDFAFSDERCAIFPKKFYQKFIRLDRGKERICCEHEIMILSSLDKKD